MERDDGLERRKRLEAWWNKILNTRVGSFSIIGIGLTLFGLVYVAAAPIMMISKDAANLQQAFISVVLNFVLNRRKTWADRRGNNRVWWQVIRFIFSKVGTILLNMQLFSIFLIAFQSQFGDAITIFGGVSLLSDFTFAYLGSTAAIMYINFFNMDKFVFGGNWWPKDLLLMFIALAIWPFVQISKVYKKVRK